MRPLRASACQITIEPKLFNIADTTQFPGLGDTLKTMLDQLERCQKVRVGVAFTAS